MANLRHHVFFGNIFYGEASRLNSPYLSTGLWFLHIWQLVGWENPELCQWHFFRVRYLMGSILSIKIYLNRKTKSMIWIGWSESIISIISIISIYIHTGFILLLHLHKSIHRFRKTFRDASLPPASVKPCHHMLFLVAFTNTSFLIFSHFSCFFVMFWFLLLLIPQFNILLLCWKLPQRKGSAKHPQLSVTVLPWYLLEWVQLYTWEKRHRRV